jgi:hypothetical protein
MTLDERVLNVVTYTDGVPTLAEVDDVLCELAKQGRTREIMADFDEVLDTRLDLMTERHALGTRLGGAA